MMTTISASKLGKWLALTAALLGWMFDGMEMGLFPLVARPALREILAEQGPDGILTRPPEDRVGKWFSVATAGFLVGAATGGVLFGWLGDRIGRVRAMTFSVLTYALVTGLCALADNVWEIVALRFIAALGMGGEWSLGVALVNEIWPDRSRVFLAGLIGAAANVGFFMCGAMSKGLEALSDQSLALLAQLGLSQGAINQLMASDRWRLLMILGASPALLAFFIRLFVPESKRWEVERNRGAASHWAGRDLLGVLIGALATCVIIYLWADDNMPLVVRIPATLIGLAMAAAGFIYPVRCYLDRTDVDHLPAEHRPGPTIGRMFLGAGLAGVALVGTWGAVQVAPTYVGKMVEDQERSALLRTSPAVSEDAMVQINNASRKARETTQMWSAVGAIVFSILAAFFSDWLGRRVSYFIQCAASLISVVCLYQGGFTYGPGLLFMVFLMGGLASTFYGWLPLYLPELFRTTIRATGQGFCYNFGRIIAAIIVLQLGNFYKLMENEADSLSGYTNACTTISLTYMVGMVIIWFAPETKGRPLPE